MALTMVTRLSPNGNSAANIKSAATMLATNGGLFIASVMVSGNNFNGSTITAEGAGITWSEVTSAWQLITSANYARITTFKGTGTGSTGSVAFYFGAQTADFARGDVTEVVGSVAASPIVQSTVSAQANSVCSVPLGSFADAANNIAYAAFCLYRSSGAVNGTPSAGMTEIRDGTQTGITCYTEYRVGENLLPGVVPASAIEDYAAVGLEIAAAGAAPAGGSPFYYINRRKHGHTR